MAPFRRRDPTADAVRRVESIGRAWCMVCVPGASTDAKLSVSDVVGSNECVVSALPPPKSPVFAVARALLLTRGPWMSPSGRAACSLHRPSATAPKYTPPAPYVRSAPRRRRQQSILAVAPPRSRPRGCLRRPRYVILLPHQRALHTPCTTHAEHALRTARRPRAGLEGEIGPFSH